MMALLSIGTAVLQENAAIVTSWLSRAILLLVEGILPWTVSLCLERFAMVYYY